MNREIKFRGRRIDNRNWIVGFYGCSCGKHYITYVHHEAPSFSDPGGCDIEVTVEVDGETVGQYTGLKDKNGKEIYEGDICRLFSCDRQIAFQQAAFGYMTELNNDNAEFIPVRNYHFNWVNNQSDKIEIIGNIYENPELLK